MIPISGTIESINMYSSRRTHNRWAGSRAKVLLIGAGHIQDVDGNDMSLLNTQFVFYIDRSKVSELKEGDTVDIRCKAKGVTLYDGIELNYVRIKPEDEEDKMLEEWKLRGVI